MSINSFVKQYNKEFTYISIYLKAISEKYIIIDLKQISGIPLTLFFLYLSEQQFYLRRR